MKPNIARYSLAALLALSAGASAQITTWYSRGANNSAAAAGTPASNFVDLGANWKDTYISALFPDSDHAAFAGMQSNMKGQRPDNDTAMIFVGWDGLTIGGAIQTATYYFTGVSSTPEGESNTWYIVGINSAWTESTTWGVSNVSGGNTMINRSTADVTNYGSFTTTGPLVEGTFYPVDVTAAVQAYKDGLIQGFAIVNTATVNNYEGRSNALVMNTADNATTTLRPGLLVTSAPTDITPPTLVGTDITDDAGGPTVSVGQRVTYTVTFSEDMDASTVTVDDFNNASSAFATVESVTESAPGVFKVVVVPFQVGSLTLRVKAGSVLTDVWANPLDTTAAILDDTTLSITLDTEPPTLVSDDISVTDPFGNPIDGPLPANTPVLYTVNFGEDMDPDSVTAEDFATTGTSTTTIGAIHEISPGVFTVEVIPSTEGYFQLEVVDGAVFTDSSANSFTTTDIIPDNQIISVGSDSTPPTLAGSDFTDTLNGQPATMGTVVTYTLDFGEDIDANTVTVDDFGNAGTADFTITSVNEVSPGVFEITGFPTSTGTVQFQVNQDAQILDYYGNPLDTTAAVLDDTITTIDPDTLPPVITGGDITPTNPDGSPISGPTVIGEPVVYTFDFGEAVDPTSVDASDFSNAGTADVTIGTITEVSPGVFEVEFIPTSTGTLIGQVSSGAVITDISGNPLDTSTAIVDNTVIEVGNDVTPPTLTALNITNDTVGSTATVGQRVTYTLLFSEDMNASTVGIDDFANANAAFVSIESVTEVGTGMFEVLVIPVTPGSLKFRVRNTAVIADNSGNTLDVTAGIDDDETITIIADNADPVLTAGDTTLTDTNGNPITGPVLANTTVLYTVTFPEDMDADSITADDFSNLGTAAVTLGAITETSPGEFTIEVTPTTDGYVQLQLDPGVVVTDLGGNPLDTTNAIVFDEILSVGTDSTPPTLTPAGIIDGSSGNSIAVGTLSTYTFLFSEDIDASTLTAADFSNSGTAAVTIGSITEISPGVFQVTIIPTSAGTLQMQINPGSQILDFYGNPLDTTNAIKDNNVILITEDTAGPVLTGEDITPTTPTGDPITDPVSVGVPILYTFDFGEDVDASTVTAEDFSNAGTADVTIGDITEVSPGVFEVEFIPTSPGTVVGQISEGAVIEDISGNPLDTNNAFTDDTSVTVIPAPVGTPIVQTFDFGQDIDASTVTAEDFVNGGSADVTIGTITEVSPGVFEVEFIPTSPGTVVGELSPTAQIDNAAGDPVDTTDIIADEIITTIDPVEVGAPVVYTFDFGPNVDPSTVTAVDFVNAGTADVTIGTITEVSPGVFEVEFIPTSPGTLAGELSPTAVIEDTNGDPIDISTVTPDETTIDVGPAVIGTPMIATFDFGTDIDASTVSAVDFTSTGTAGYTIGTITEVTPGVFQVEYIPTGPGTIVPDVSPTAVINDSLGNPVDPNTGSTSPTPIDVVPSTGDTYPVWSGNTPSSADTNGDGVSNGTAWVLGATSPTANAADVMPTTSVGPDGSLEMSFSILNSASRGAAQVILQQSSDLGMTDAWTEVIVPDTTSIAPINGVTFTVMPGDPLNNVTLSVAPAQGAGGKLFSRLKIVTP